MRKITVRLIEKSATKKISPSLLNVLKNMPPEKVYSYEELKALEKQITTELQKHLGKEILVAFHIQSGKNNTFYLQVSTPAETYKYPNIEKLILPILRTHSSKMSPYMSFNSPKREKLGNKNYVTEMGNIRIYP